MDNKLSLVEKLIAAKCSEEEFSAYFPVNCKYHEASNKIEVFIDGDSGVNLGVLSAMTRYLRKELELQYGEEDDFSLEVSSPGVGSPLVKTRQYHANMGRQMEVLTHEGIKHSGKLLEVAEDSILLGSASKGKAGKIPAEPVEIMFEAIKEARVMAGFK